MEKVLVTKYGDCIVYDTEQNAIVKTSERYTNTALLIKMRKDGQVITNTKVIDVKAGDIVMPQSFYSNKEEDNICEIVVIHDPVAAYDLDEVEKLKVEHKKSNK